MRLKAHLSLLLLFYLAICHAAKVDTIEVHSKSMNKNIKTVVITPDNYNTHDSLPVIYLLHGYSGNYADWVTKTDVKMQADLYNFIIICPDGANSWYFDSPINSKFKYETYISHELVDYIDNNYATIRSKKGRAILGLSMGGHGALYLAIKNQNIYGATGSMSGGVDIRPFPNNWELPDCLGSYSKHPDNWENNTVINMVHLLTPNSLAITFDCGSDDFFYKVNCNLHDKLLERNIPHDFTVRPGGHSWEYWSKSIKYNLLFMHEFFISK